MSARWLTTADEAEWRAALPASRSAFGSLEFARAHEAQEGGEARLLVADGVAYPLLLRPLDALQLRAEAGPGKWDAASPPFTGPIASAEGSTGVAEIATALAAEGIVSEFAHLHPFSSRPELVGGGEPDREIVWVDLTLEPERLWRESYSRACRKNVGRARREGVTVRAARDEADIGEFHRIYIATMERNEALDPYMFPLSYFLGLFGGMGENARFALAERGGEVIAATLYLHDGDDVYSYLGGADHGHQHLRPTNAVVDETITWARDAGKRRLILGGGYQPGDGIFHFKAGFSPERAMLRLVRRIHLADEYERLADAWRAHHGTSGEGVGFFPLYRATP